MTASDPADKPTPAPATGQGGKPAASENRSPDERLSDEERAKRDEEQLDEGLEDSFPASDPPAITQPVHRHEPDEKGDDKDRD